MWLLLAVVGAVLLVATTVSGLLGYLRPSLDLREVRIKIHSWWVMAGLFAAIVLPGNALSYVALAGLCAASVWELARLLRKANAGERARVRALWYRGLALVVLGLGHTLLILALGGARPEEPRWGPTLLFYVVILTELGDVGAYLTGKLWGRRKLAPKLSPGKSVEGFVGGMFCCIGTAWALKSATPFDDRTALLAGTLVGVTGTLGDLSVSAIKRAVGQKDAGTLIPGHGGLLDRIDSLCLSAPCFFWFVTCGPGSWG